MKFEKEQETRLDLLKQVVNEVNLVKSKSKKSVNFGSHQSSELRNAEALKAAIFNGRRTGLRLDGDSNTFKHTTIDLIKKIEKDRLEKK